MALAEVRTALKNLRAHFVGRQGKATVFTQPSVKVDLALASFQSEQFARSAPLQRGVWFHRQRAAV